MLPENRINRKLTVGIVSVILLVLCLGITTYALSYASVSVDNNLFRTGTVDINLNDGKQVISKDEFIFEPGILVKKDFFIKNQSTWDVYYRIYFEEVEGGLSDVLEVTIRDEERDETLYKGTPAELVRNNVSTSEEVLKVNEQRDLTIYFYFPKEKGNEAQDQSLSFRICADAVQTKNNPDKLFD